MGNNGPDNDFIMVFDGWPWKNMVNHQKPSKTVVTMVIISPVFNHQLEVKCKFDAKKVTSLSSEPRCEKTNILVFDLARHKPGCTATDDG